MGKAKFSYPPSTFSIVFTTQFSISYHTDFHSVGMLPPRKAHIVQHICIYLDHNDLSAIRVWRVSRHTGSLTRSNIQINTKFIRFGDVLDLEMSTCYDHEERKCLCRFSTGGAMNCKSTAFKESSKRF